MQLKTDYREETVGVLNGAKRFFLLCHVEFNQQERSIIDERGMYDEAVQVPANTPPPTRLSDFTAMLLRIAGIILMPLGFLASCVTGLMPHSTSSAAWFMLCLLGVGLFAVGKFKDISANKREDNPVQKLTIRRLLTDPEFMCYAPDLQVAKVYEELVHNQLKELVENIRATSSAPEKNTYEL